MIREHEYSAFLADIKKQIERSRSEALSSLNQHVIRLYWEIGKAISERQESLRWGDGVIRRLSEDLRRAYPGTKGFSAANLAEMRRFYRTYRDAANSSAAAGRLGWTHNVLIFNKVEVEPERLWYLEQAYVHGWSRRFLAHQIDSGLYQRQSIGVSSYRLTTKLPRELKGNLPSSEQLEKHLRLP